MTESIKISEFLTRQKSLKNCAILMLDFIKIPTHPSQGFRYRFYVIFHSREAVIINPTQAHPKLSLYILTHTTHPYSTIYIPTYSQLLRRLHGLSFD